MENIVYNELARRGFRVDVGVVKSVEKNASGKSVRWSREIDFVVNEGMKKLYIQSALEIPDDRKREQESTSLRKTGDYFRKIIVLGGSSAPKLNEDGILTVGVIPFVLDCGILDSCL